MYTYVGAVCSCLNLPLLRHLDASVSLVRPSPLRLPFTIILTRSSSAAAIHFSSSWSLLVAPSLFYCLLGSVSACLPCLIAGQYTLGTTRDHDDDYAWEQILVCNLICLSCRLNDLFFVGNLEGVIDGWLIMSVGHQESGSLDYLHSSVCPNSGPCTSIKTSKPTKLLTQSPRPSKSSGHLVKG